ncbi:hypothetical protein C8F04DRAFT_1233808 [Mycena alexandri]|uniref:NodB homology domain-containing protein n=1 Tax=Mycena alexandri TaxID=1745969 RepID=A0AAD6SWK2_9AGAR|nr:hypothetical protein C8F04DRAFT_1233808 [Mycena alexandri]
MRTFSVEGSAIYEQQKWEWEEGDLYGDSVVAGVEEPSEQGKESGRDCGCQFNEYSALTTNPRKKKGDAGDDENDGKGPKHCRFFVDTEAPNFFAEQSRITLESPHQSSGPKTMGFIYFVFLLSRTKNVRTGLCPHALEYGREDWKFDLTRGPAIAELLHLPHLCSPLRKMEDGRDSFTPRHGRGIALISFDPNLGHCDAPEQCHSLWCLAKLSGTSRGFWQLDSERPLCASHYLLLYPALLKPQNENLGIGARPESENRHSSCQAAILHFQQDRNSSTIFVSRSNLIQAAKRMYRAAASLNPPVLPPTGFSSPPSSATMSIPFILTSLLTYSAVLGSPNVRRAPQVYDACINANDIALTFDDGIILLIPLVSFVLRRRPGPYIYLRSISDQFTAAGAKATFYMNGNNFDCIYNAARISDVKYAYAAGHMIGRSHADLTTLSTAQIQDGMFRMEEAFSRILGIKPAFMRPPFGSYNDNIQSIAAGRGQNLALWDWDTGDADGNTTAQSEALYNDVISAKVKNALILEHETEETTANVLVPFAIKLFQGKGYNVTATFKVLPLLDDFL